MLQTQSIYPATLELLKKLMAFEPLNQFNLVGGTALALQFWHRISVDLDLFSDSMFKELELKSVIESFATSEGFTFEWEMVEEVSLVVNINNIKVDIIRYPYPLIDTLIVEEGIRVLSPKDIAPMKLSAIAKRGAKKDFFDFYELSKKYSLQEMLQFYQEKFPHTDTTFLLRSLVYFNDAELQDDPIMLKPYTWEQVKKEITKQVNTFFEEQI